VTSNTPDAEKAAIARYVHEFREADGVLNTSTFRAALRDARRLGGRSLDTGAVEAKITASWPGALVYLILMDQVGKVIQPVLSARTTTSNDLRTALEEFDSGLDSTDRDMLYALRCALGHEFAMANENARYPSLQHRFQLTEAGERKLVVYNGQWNGKYASQSVGGPTEVNLTELTEVVENVVRDIETQCDAGDLRLVGDVTPEMVPFRWCFRVLPGTADGKPGPLIG